MKFGLTDETINIIHSVFKRHKELHRAVIYGSRAKGNFKNGSDIDIVLFGEGLDVRKVYMIENNIDVQV